MQEQGEVVVMEGGKYSRSVVKHLTLVHPTGQTQVFRNFSGKLTVDTANETLSLVLSQQRMLWSDLLMIALSAIISILVYRAWLLL